MPEPVYSVGGGANFEFDTEVFRFHYDSYVTPDTEYDYHLDRRERKMLKQREVRGYEPAKYRSGWRSSWAADGTRVPISLVYRIDRRAGAAQPLLLYGYGAYGYPLGAGFRSARLSLVRRGAILPVRDAP